MTEKLPEVALREQPRTACIQIRMWERCKLLFGIITWGEGGWGGVLQQLNSNQHRNPGRGSSLHFPWVRLLQGPQLSDTFSSPFHGWWGDSQAQQQSNIFSRRFSGNLLGEDGCSQHKESGASIFRGYDLVLSPRACTPAIS